MRMPDTAANDNTWIDIDKDDPRAHVSIYRGPFGIWHVETGSLHSGRRLTDNLRTTLNLLRSEGYLKVSIKRGGTQRPRYETRYL